MRSSSIAVGGDSQCKICSIPQSCFLSHAGIALALSILLRLPVADAALLMVLAASASYIVVPAVLRYAIPEANPSLYFGLSLGVTFPLNILFGIPLYAGVARHFLG